MSGHIGLGMRLELPEWNRRAMVALRGVNFSFGEPEWKHK